jgi:hypothetical protein
LQYTLEPTGYNTVNFNLDFIDLSIYGNSFATFRTFLEILFCFLVFIYCLIFIYDIKKAGDEMRKEFNDKLAILM